MAMEAAIDMLQKGGVEEFMQISSTALKVIQNVLTYPMEDKYRRIRTTCKYIAKPGAAELLVAVGFERKEHLPYSMLDRLHSSDLSEGQVLSFVKQVSVGMEYLHSVDTLHCDLAARNLLLGANETVKIANFGSSRTLTHRPSDVADGTNCEGTTLSIRWMAPEVLQNHHFSKPSDVWSFGVLVYEFVTMGSVPYASYSNAEVKAKAIDGYRLPQPQGCQDDLYAFMLKCWAQKDSERPSFFEMVEAHLLPLENSCGKKRPHQSEEYNPSSPESRRSSSKLSRKQSKVKEHSYPAVTGKGGGLVRVYTSLVSLLHRRVVVVCSRKTTVAEIMQTALAKCGKLDNEAKDHHSIALVSGRSSNIPARYLDPEDHVLSVKAGMGPASQFVLCARMPGPALLEIIDSKRGDPVFKSAFDQSTRGYLLFKEGGAAGKQVQQAQQAGEGKEGDWKRFWCVLDGSTLLCYLDEEDEGKKQFEEHLEFRACDVAMVTSKKRYLFSVVAKENRSFIFSAIDKSEMLQWIEAIESSKTLEPSPVLLHATGGAVVQAGHLDCQEFALEGRDRREINPLQPLVQRQLGSLTHFAGTHTAIDYGKHWSVLKSTGEVQCLVDGRPEALFDLKQCKVINVVNPKVMREGVDYSIEVTLPGSRLVLHAEIPTDHFDWVLAIENVLKEQGRENMLRGNSCRESGYVALKRLLMLRGPGGRGSKQLYSLPPCFNDMEDIYTNPRPSDLGPSDRPEFPVLQGGNKIPLPPKDYLPPPLPPRSEDPPPPPLPPKSSKTTETRTPSICSNGSFAEEGRGGGDDYVMMLPQALTSPTGGQQPPPPPRLSHSSATTPSPKCPLRTNGSQPITIPNRRTSKRSILLRADSDSSSYIGSPPSNQNQDWTTSSMSFQSHSHSRNTSTSSISSLMRVGQSPAGQRKHGGGGYHSALLNGSPSGNNSNLYTTTSTTSGGAPSSLKRSQSNCVNIGRERKLPGHAFMGDQSVSDGLTVMEAQQCIVNTSLLESRDSPVSRSLSSDAGIETNGYWSHSSSEEIDREKDKQVVLPPGWKRGYSESNSKHFYFHANGKSFWSIQEVLLDYQQEKRKSKECGPDWQVARTDDGQIYYYHGVTRQTTWNIEDTL